HSINRMIQCRAEIVNDFSEHDAPHRWTWCVDEHSHRDIKDESAFAAPVYALEFDGRFVGCAVKEGSHFLLERIELIAGALQFQPDSGERIIRHGKTPKSAEGFAGPESPKG